MSDDLTKNLPGGEGRYDTNPTMETLLERINDLGEGLGIKIDKVRDDLSAEIDKVRDELRGEITSVRSELGAEIQSLRSEMNEQFAKVADQFKVLDKKVDILTREVLDVKVRQELADDRIEKLEEKTS